MPLCKGHRSLLVVSVYGISGAHPQKNPQKFQENEAFLSELFAWLAGFGTVPCFVCADLNCDPTLSPSCVSACSIGGWSDLGAESGSHYTFQAVRHKKLVQTRIDVILCSQAARPFVSDFKVIPLGIPNHLGLSVSLKLPAFDAKIKVFRSPKPFPCLPMSSAQRDLLTFFPSQDDEWCDHIHNSRIDDAWQLFCSKSLSLLHGKKVPVDRGVSPSTRSRLLFKPQSADTGSLSIRVARLFKLQRRIQECAFQLASGLLADSQVSVITRDLRRFCDCDFSSLPLAAEQVKNSVHCELQLENRIRINNWRSKLQASWSATKQAVYKWIRLRKALAATPEFTTTPGGLCAAPEVLLQKVVKKWSDIYRHYSSSEPPSWDAFFDRYGSYIQKCDVAIPPLDFRRLKRFACGSGSKAPGLDAWDCEAFKLWPDIVWCRLCELLTAIEKCGSWPSNLLNLLVTLIPKPHGVSSDDVRPITIASKIYRAWATHRARDLASWQSKWAPPQVYGGVSGRRSSDLYLRVALELEHACSGGAPLAILLLDLSKFFDRLPWQIEYPLLDHFGCPTQVSRPKRHMATCASRWFRLGPSVASPLLCTNGTPQGCPLSVFSVNALTAVWARVLRAEAPDTQCGAFVDDRSLRACSRPALQKGVALTDEIDRLSGSIPNRDKTGLIVTHLSLEQQFNAFFHGPYAVAPASCGKLLGVGLPSRSAANCDIGRDRSLEAITAARRIQYAPLHFEAKHSCIATVVIPTWQPGLELGGHPVAEESKLRHAVAEALNFTRSFASRDVFFSLCTIGYLIDPHQVRVLHTLGSANSFLRRWPDVHETWTSVWHHRAGSGVQGRFGLGAQVQRACSLLGIQWSEPFKLEWNNGTLSLLSSDRTHFLDTLRSLARVTVLARAAKRPCLKGLGPGVDFVATRVSCS